MAVSWLHASLMRFLQYILLLRGTRALLVRVFLGNAIGYMGCNGSHFCCPLHMEHLVIEVDVWPYLLQHGTLWGSGEEQCLVSLQAPGSECFQGADARAGSGPCSHQVGTDGTVQTMTLCIELLLKFPQGLQETLQWTLQEAEKVVGFSFGFLRKHRHWS